MSEKKILAIIPARGGSKGIVGKNIRLLNEKPLICYTIEEALKSIYLNEVFVSTDDLIIAKISEKCGAKIIDRPAELAKDESPTIDAIFNAIEFIKNVYDKDIIILLQPTSPLRNAIDIDTAFNIFMKTECDSVISMCKVEHPPYWHFKYEGDKFKPLFGEKYLLTNRQELPDVYRPNGAIYITTIKNLYENNGFYCDKVVPYIMPSERSIDIDEEIDLKLAEILIQEGTTNANHG